MSQKGILGRKLGMTQVFDDANRVIPVSVIEAGPCRVVQLRTPERDGYSAVQLAFGDTKPARLNKPELGHLKAAGGPPQKYLAELRVDDLAGFELGQVIAADVFAAGDRVDVSGVSKGSGFSGVMKRHNFSGQGASHGNHKKHRSPGSIGACATPARVFKGMKMAGQMGNAKVTTLNLVVVEGDAERGLLLIRGSIPGPTGGLVFVRSAVKAGVRSEQSRDEEGRRRGRVERRAPRRRVRHRAQRRSDAPGRHRAARRAARRHAQHEDPRRSPRRRREAVAPEGHRPRPARFDPRAAVARRWRRSRPPPPRLLAADAQEDDPPRGSQRAVRSGGRGQGHRRRRLGHHRTEHQVGRATARVARPAQHPEGNEGRVRAGAEGAKTRSNHGGSSEPAVLLVLVPHRGSRVEVGAQPRRAGADAAPRGAQHLRRPRSTTGSCSRRRRSTQRSRASPTVHLRSTTLPSTTEAEAS